MNLGDQWGPVFEPFTDPLNCGCGNSVSVGRKIAEIDAYFFGSSDTNNTDSATLVLDYEVVADG